MFDVPPSVEFLTTLSRGSLRQDLSRAVRSWVILQSIYGGIELGLEPQFTYNQWRDLFFTQVDLHHKRDLIPTLHDPTCGCAVSLKDWLFHAEIGANESEWSRAFLQLYQLSQLELKQLVETGFSGSRDTTSATGRKRLPEGRLFAVTGKQLQKDFEDLAKAGWLIADAERSNTYMKVTQFPNALPASVKLEVRDFVENAFLSELRGALIATDAVDLFEHLGQPIRGIQRLFLDIEYIVPGKLSEQVATFQQQLKRGWEQHPVLPIALTYRSARRYGEVKTYVSYPVCVRYFQRAPYLYAYGEHPCAEGSLNWYDFRLDRIEALEILEWEDERVSEGLRDRCLRQSPPNPEQVQQLLSEVWGFDIYREPELLLVRFNQYFHAHYVANTEREAFLVAVQPRVAKRMVRAANLLPSQQGSLLQVLQEKPKDIYCRVNYRQEDRNVLMRLRAWGGNVEVLLPWSLRLQMAKDAREVWKLYQSVEGVE
jgi:CRISPR-associated protein (TIGR03985 family)